MSFRFTLRQLEYFIAVCDAGSIAAAAEKLNVSSPSISSAIGQLESEFAVELFVRQHAKGLAMTAGGRRFYASAQAVLEQAHALRDTALEISEVVRGPITVGSLVTIAPFLLPELRSSFELTHPEVTFRQVEGAQTELFDKLRWAEIDIALTYDLDIPSDVAFEPIRPLRPYALFSDSHPLAQEQSVSLAELAEHDLILLDIPISRDYFMSLFQAKKLEPVIKARTPNLFMVHSMVANGIGYGLLNVPIQNPNAPDGKPLRYVAIQDDARPMQLGLATIRSERRSAVVAAFEEFCRREITSSSLFEAQGTQGKGI